MRISFGEPPVEYGLPDLLPQRFGPADLLGDSGAPLLLQPQHNHVTFAAGSASAALQQSAAAATRQLGASRPVLSAVSGIVAGGRESMPSGNENGSAQHGEDVPGAQAAKPTVNGMAGPSGLDLAAEQALRAANQVRDHMTPCQS